MRYRIIYNTFSISSELKNYIENIRYIRSKKQ